MNTKDNRKEPSMTLLFSRPRDVSPNYGAANENEEIDETEDNVKGYSSNRCDDAGVYQELGDGVGHWFNENYSFWVERCGGEEAHDLFKS